MRIPTLKTDLTLRTKAFICILCMKILLSHVILFLSFLISNGFVYAKTVSEWKAGEYATYFYQGTDGYKGGVIFTVHPDLSGESPVVLLAEVNLRNRFGDVKKGYGVYQFEESGHFHMVQYEHSEHPGEDIEFKVWLQEFIGSLIISNRIGKNGFGETESAYQRHLNPSCCGIAETKRSDMSTYFFKVKAQARAYLNENIPITGVERSITESYSDFEYRRYNSGNPEKQDELILTSYGIKDISKGKCNQSPSYIDFNGSEYANFEDYRIRIPSTWMIYSRVDSGNRIRGLDLGGCKHTGMFRMTELSGTPHELESVFRDFAEEGQKGLFQGEPVLSSRALRQDERSVIFLQNFRVLVSDFNYVKGMFFNGAKDKLVKVEIMTDFSPSPNPLKEEIRRQENPELIRIVESFEYRTWWSRWLDYLWDLIFFEVSPAPFPEYIGV